MHEAHDHTICIAECICVKQGLKQSPEQGMHPNVCMKYSVSF